MAGSGSALPGMDSASVKVTRLDEYPGKGRGTGGVRCHRLRAGEDALLLAYAGSGPAMASTAAGVAIPLPDPDGKRDGSGSVAEATIACLGGAL